MWYYRVIKVWNNCYLCPPSAGITGEMRGRLCTATPHNAGIRADGVAKIYGMPHISAMDTMPAAGAGGVRKTIVGFSGVADL